MSADPRDKASELNEKLMALMEIVERLASLASSTVNAVVTPPQGMQPYDRTGPGIVAEVQAGLAADKAVRKAEAQALHAALGGLIDAL